MNGWTGKMLRVNLGRGTVKTEDINPKTMKDFIGGRGVGSKLLYDEVDAKTEPLSPKNKLIFAAGPLTGTSASAAGRYMVLAKSPLTGTIACSNSGGHFGPELKFAGFDMIVFEGRASSPVYLWVDNGRAELRPARKLWGMKTNETDAAVREATDPGARIASIGPAGENQVRFACVVNDLHRAAGRSGVGAVMGSKNLKAVAVRGTGGVTVADAPGFREACLRVLKMLKEHPVTSQALPAYGTAVLVNIVNESGLLPTRNFQEGQFAKASQIGGEALAEKYLVRNKACFGCPMACGRVTEITGGVFAGKGEGPEYESAWALGACCGVGDLAAIAKANFLGNEYGFDPISAGVTVACAMELFQRKYITEKDAGMKLAFGDAEAMVKAMEMLAKREGFGNILAEGSYRMAERFGHSELSMSVKKQEFPAYDGRGAKGMALNYATSNRGACHVRGYMISPEILGVPEKLDPLTTKDKAAWDIAMQNLTAAVDSSGLCLFTIFGIGAPEISALLAKATGAGYTEQSMLKAGERVWNLERLYNLKAGFTDKDDTLPPRFFKEKLPKGAARDQVVELDVMLPEYYGLRGWDARGVPTKKKLGELGLK